MESIQKGPKNNRRATEDELRGIALSVISRGIDINDLTFGEIIYIERAAHERDRIQWACSAQNKDLLPKKRKSVKQAWTNSVTKHFPQGNSDVKK